MQNKKPRMIDVGQEEMQLLRRRYLGHTPTAADNLPRGRMPFLALQLSIIGMYRLKILRY